MGIRDTLKESHECPTVLKLTNKEPLTVPNIILVGQAVRDGIEPSTGRLTVACSTAELPNNISGEILQRICHPVATHAYGMRQI